MLALTMQSVGTRLREARIKKGYTLEDINARTRISLKNLTAIESDDLSKISSPFTYRSFVKQVSDMVGLDHAMLAADAQAASSTMPEVLVPGQEEELFTRPQQFQPVKPKPSWNWVRTASIIAAVGAVSAYLFWRNSGIEAAKLPSGALPSSSRIVTPDLPASSALATQSEQQRTSPSSAPVILPVSAKSENMAASSNAPLPGTEQLMPPGQTSQAVKALSQSVSPQESAAATIHIELSAIQPTWLTISSDGKTTFNGKLAAMQTMSFDGRETAQIRTANAGGVNIIFNGRALGPLGRRGQARTFVFTKSGYEVVQGLRTLAHIIPTGGF